MALQEIFLYLILPAAVFFYFFFKKKYSYFSDLGIPHTKPKWPLGNLQGVGSKYHFFDFVLNTYNENRGKDIICGFYSFIQPIYVVLDPELAKTILVKDFNSFVNRGQFVNEKDEPLTGHLFSIENEQWRFLRNKLSPVFTSGKLKAMYPIIINKGDNLVAAIERDTAGGRSIEAKNMASRFTVDIISSVAFGMEANTLNNENLKLLTMLKEIFGAGAFDMAKFFFMTSYPNFSKKLHLRLFSKSLSDFFTDVVAENIKHREESNDKRKDFLNMLIQLKNKGSIDGEFSSDVKKLSLNEIMAQAFLFFFAGSDTSSTAISLALAELSNNQEVQDKLRKEINEKSKEMNGEITYEAIHEMKYLDMVVNEALRMYPPAINSIRETFKDYQVPNSKYIIPKGAPVWINSLGFHYDEKYYPNPTKFDPERFTQEEINKRPAFTFLPFGEGPRNCIGMRLGLLNVKLGVYFVIKNFKVTPDPRLKFPIKMAPSKPTLEAEGGTMLRFKKIEV